MSNLMRDPCTSISPRSDWNRHLIGSVLPVDMVTLNERREMYALLRAYFSGTTRGRFEADLREKEHVILLRDAGSGRVHGFSTFVRMAIEFDGTRVVAFFSGDTIVERDYWGETVLSRIWGQTIVDEAERVRAQQPDTQVYWFLICSGYKTWRFLPVFFRDFYPNPEATTPPRVKRVIDALGTAKFGDEYLPEEGIVRFRQATPLRRGVAEITDGRLRDPRIAFFVQKNPGHAGGDELACLAELSRANLTRAALRMLANPREPA